MKKKITLVATSVLLVAAMVIGGTLAYFTDQTNVATNVMTMGKVSISQDEAQRNQNQTGTAAAHNPDNFAFEQRQALMPMVDNKGTGATVVDGYFNPAMENVIDKVITVKNEAAQGAINQDVYVRTIIAFETARHYAPGSSTEFTDMHDTYIGVLGDFEYLGTYITVDDVEYVLAVKVYENALVPQEVSAPSLKQIFLAPTANNEVMDIFGDEYTILALSQGVQTDGFGSAAEALDTAFGAVTAENAQKWFTTVAS